MVTPVSLTQIATNTHIFVSEYDNTDDRTFCSSSNWVGSDCARLPVKTTSSGVGKRAYYCTDLGGSAAAAKGIYLFIDPNDTNSHSNYHDMAFS